MLGNTRWNRYGNLDRTVFFKDRVVFISTYHAKRDSQAILDFDRAYIRAFGALPSLYSYRGYDAALIFCPAMYNDIEYDLEGRSYTPLQTTYLFGRAARQPRQPQLDAGELQQRLYDNHRIKRPLWQH